jgi:hypothetical protein
VATDQELIVGHPFQPMRDGWEDTCGHLDLDGWTCDYTRAEHADQDLVDDNPKEAP